MNSERQERKVYAKAAEYADFLACFASSWRSWRLKTINVELLASGRLFARINEAVGDGVDDHLGPAF
jgi:hypothetical protein